MRWIRIFCFLGGAFLSSSLVFGQVPGDAADSEKSKQKFHIGAAIDVYGPVVRIPMREYFRISPEIEFALPGKAGISFILDAAFRHSETYFDTNWNGTEAGKASIYVKTKSICAGVRKYFRPGKSEWPLGGFVEMTAGYEHQFLDTAYNFLTAEPQLDDFEYHDRFTMKLKLGYQGFFTKRFIFSASMSADLRRIVEKDVILRILTPEMNLGFMI